MLVFDFSFNSFLFNALEYVVFDLVLAILVHVLTSKLVGLYNCYDALKNHRRSLIREDSRTPLFGAGILCTQKKLFYAIVAVRTLSWILIFGPNLFIRERTEKTIKTINASVTTLGRFSVFDPTEQRRQQLFLRKACVGRTENSSYYGEIRNGSCQIDRRLFSGPAVEFGLKFEPTFVSINGCRPKNGSLAKHQSFECNNTATTTTASTTRSIIQCTFNETDGKVGDELCFPNGTAPFTPCVRKAPREQKENVSFVCGAGENMQDKICSLAHESSRIFSICDNAVIACRFRPKGLICAGFVNINATTHMCENLEMRPQPNPNAKCKVAKGAEWHITDCIPFYGLEGLDSISTAFDVAYASGSESRLVKEFAAEKRSLTSVNILWAGAFAANIFIVAVLYVLCEFLSRRYEVFVVANDETRILSLLNATVSRIRDGTAPETVSNDIKLRVSLNNGVVCLHDE